MTLNNDSISIKDYEGKVVVLNSWHTKCGPCIVEISGLNKLVDMYKSDSSIIFIALSYDNKDGLVSFLKEKEFNYMHAFGNAAFYKIVGESFPTNIIIDKNGVITYFSTGANKDTYKVLEKQIKEILTKKNAV